MAPSHGDFDEAAAGLAGDLLLGEALLGALEVLLHLLGLLEDVAESAFHLVIPRV
jgi:hypothetical protein